MYLNLRFYDILYFVEYFLMLAVYGRLKYVTEITIKDKHIDIGNLIT